MALSLRNVLLSSNVRRVCACLIGYTLWYMVSAHYMTSQTVHVPLHFHNTQNSKIDAPKSVIITMQGPRKYLRALNISDLAAHIDAQKIPSNTSYLALEPKQLNLHKDVHLVDYTPTLIKKITQKNA